MIDGGYDIGYKACKCFWGSNPGSLIMKLTDLGISYGSESTVLDLGCGEGKNSIFFAKMGCHVDAIDISDYAIQNASLLCHKYQNINLKVADVTKVNMPYNYYNIIIAYGLFHCFKDINDVESLIRSCLHSLKKEGIFIICAFNNRKHNLSAHKDFNPLLLSHSSYLGCFSENKIIFQSDEDLYEVHPHNGIPHMHSMTRLIIRK